MFATRCSSLTARKASAGRLLAPEELDDGDPREVLLQEGVHPGDSDAHLPVGVARPLAEPVRHERHRDEDAERDRRESRVEEVEDRHDAAEDGEVPEEGDEARREELVERVDVGRQARHEPPDGRPVEERDVGPLEVGEDPRAQVEHDPLAHPRRPLDHQDHQAEGREDGEEVEDRDRVEGPAAAGRQAEAFEESGDEGCAPFRRPGLRREDEVDGGPRQERPGELGGRLEEEDDEGAAGVPPVGEGEGEEAAEETAVETAPLRFVFLEVLGHRYAASTSSESLWRSASSA